MLFVHRLMRDNMGKKISEHIVELTREEVLIRGERIAQKYLNCTWEEAVRKFRAGEIEEDDLSWWEVSSVLHLLGE